MVLAKSKHMQKALWWTIPAIERSNVANLQCSNSKHFRFRVFALDSDCLHHKLYREISFSVNFASANFRSCVISLNRNSAYVDTKFRKDLREISLHLTKVFVWNFFAKFRRTFARTKDEIRRTSLSLLLHKTVAFASKVTWTCPKVNWLVDYDVRFKLSSLLALAKSIYYCYGVILSRFFSVDFQPTIMDQKFLGQ